MLSGFQVRVSRYSNYGQIFDLSRRGGALNALFWFWTSYNPAVPSPVISVTRGSVSFRREAADPECIGKGRLTREQRSLSMASGAFPSCPRLCKNHPAGHLGERLSQTASRTRIKDSLKLRFRFYCCVLSTGSCVFTQPGPKAAAHGSGMLSPNSVKWLRS